MAVTHWYTGRATETTATVVVRADSTGDVAVVANGATLQAACDTSVNDGNALVEFTGLTPGQQYAYTVGGVTGGVLRPHPATAPFWLALTSCWNITRADSLAYQLLQAPLSGASQALHAECVSNLAAFFALGDFVYMNSSGTVNGYAQTLIDGGTLANGKLVEARRQYYRAGRLTAGSRELMRSVPSYVLKDDHEYDPDNACYSTAWLARQYGGTPTESDLTDVWTAASTAWREWAIGNPTKAVSTGILGGPDCYSVRIGPVEIWCTDLIHERDDTAIADGPDKRMMSALQEEWMLAGMASSTATHKVWASTKQFISSCGRNGDGFEDLAGGVSEGYGTQLTRILSDSRFPRAGALSVTGDEHIRSDMMVSADQFGGSHAAISQIAAGPATIAVITDPDDGLAYRAGVRDKERDQSTLDQRGENSYVLLRVLSDRIERYILGSRYGLRYMGYVGTTDNAVRR